MVEDLSAAEFERAGLRARHLHVSLFFLQRRLRGEFAALLATVCAAGTTTLIDPNWDPDEEWDGGLFEALCEIDILFANGEEVTQITHRDDVDTAARTLAANGTLVVIKLGQDETIAVA